MDPRFSQAVQVLPLELRAHALELPERQQALAEEIRLRVGVPLSVVLPEGERSIGTPPVRQCDLVRLVELASRASVHTVLEQVRQGFLTVEGGHRVGLCGSVILEDGNIYRLNAFSSANLRIARQVKGVVRDVLDGLCRQGTCGSTLILAPPGGGKTTLLRDLVRTISEGEGCSPLRVGVVDERGELAATRRGVPQLDVGRRTDVLSGCPKAQGLMMLLRSMSPQVLAVDEITSPEDAAALRTADGCGVILLATAHGAGIEDLRRRPVYRELLADGLFHNLVLIEGAHGARTYCVKELTK